MLLPCLLLPPASENIAQRSLPALGTESFGKTCLRASRRKVNLFRKTFIEQNAAFVFSFSFVKVFCASEC